MLYIFKCEHGKNCNFISDCNECLKAKLSSQSAYIKRLEDALKDIRLSIDNAQNNPKELCVAVWNIANEAMKESKASKESIDG